MTEKNLSIKKNGLAVLLLSLFIYAAAISVTIWNSMNDEINGAVMAVCIFFLLTTWLLWPGLKVLRPQEALVLTLFGRYIGTLKEPGFYFVNPFCSSVNPASKTLLNQSGDVKNGNININVSDMSKKISLKIMTLNNNRQKINDCLGNPIEIGIAVTWRIQDTAKAVFNVDNYKEFLSLQCDSALRNIVRIYPYDVAKNVDTTGDGIADEGTQHIQK